MFGLVSLIFMLGLLLMLAGICALAWVDGRPRLAGFDLLIEHDDQVERPLILILHAGGSSPCAAVEVLERLTVPDLREFRLVAPAGPLANAGARSWLAPELGAEDTDKLVRAQVEQLTQLLSRLLARYPTSKRAIVVGLGEASTLAVQLGLSAQPMIRAAFGFGGSYDGRHMPLATHLSTQTQIRKLSWGPSSSSDRDAEAIAQARGFDYVVEHASEVSWCGPTVAFAGAAVPDPCDPEAVTPWLASKLLTALETP